ncbi:MAG: hypothetical protein WAN36_01355 [Calditrichia bacterium]
MKYFHTGLIVVLFAVLTIFAQEIPPPDEQIAAALQAAPEAFRENAAVLGYNPQGELVTLKKGSNEIICLADDPQRAGFSAAAYHKALEPFMARGRELRAQGKTNSEVFDIREAEAKSGKLKMPERGATLHVLSGPEGYYNPETGKVENVIYRYVVYIPWATAESTGLPASPSTPGGPWIMDPGTHRAHIMINPPADSGQK